MCWFGWFFVVDCKPQVRENVGNESREFIRYQQQWEERARREEELFVRAPITKMEKKKEKHLKKSRDGYAWFKSIIFFFGG